jgi:retron-type reverse transcriptase
MEHVIASHLRKIWDKTYWLFDGQHGFRPGYSCESQVITVYQNIADSLDNGGRIDNIIIDFSKAFDLIPHDRLLTKIAASGVDSRMVIWINKFLLGRTQKVRLRGHLSEEVRVTSDVPQGSVLGPLLFLTYVNDIGRNIESTIRLFADDCIIYREVKNNNVMENLQTDLNKLGKLAVENAMKLF